MDGYWRDEKDKIILPVIVFKRNTISKDESYALDKLDANKPVHFYPFQKKWSQFNRYDNFSIQYGIKPVSEYYSVVVPDYVTMTYEFMIMTETVDLTYPFKTSGCNFSATDIIIFLSIVTFKGFPLSFNVVCSSFGR